MPFTLAALMFAAAAASVPAQSPGNEVTSVTLRHVDRHPASRQAAARSVDRIEAAASAACGASPFSLREAREAVRHGRCWRDAMAATLAGIGDPALTRAFADQGRRRNVGREGR